MKTINKICYVLLLGLVCFIIGYLADRKGRKASIDGSDVVIVDTAYNHVVLDSIAYNIRTKDSIVVKLKEEVKYEIEQALSADDSTAVVQFMELTGTD